MRAPLVTTTVLTQLAGARAFSCHVQRILCTFFGLRPLLTLGIFVGTEPPVSACGVWILATPITGLEAMLRHEATVADALEVLLPG